MADFPGPSLAQAQVRAIGIGLVWSVPYLWISRWLPIGYSLPFAVGFPVLIACLVAMLTGRFDRLAFVSLLMPAAAEFVFSTHVDWVWHSRHVGTLIGPSPVLDFLILIAVAALAVLGIALKRWMVSKPELTAQETHSLQRGLFWDLGLLAGVAGLMLVVDAVKIAHERNPLVLAEEQGEVLTSPTATEADKLQVVMKLSYNLAPGSSDVLRLALKDPSPSVKLAAAGGLMQRGDVAGLAALEDRLMHVSPSSFTITNEHQVIHHDWLGYGEGGPEKLVYTPARCLKRVTDPSAIPMLEQLRSSEDPDIRQEAGLALEGIRRQAGQ